MKKITLNEFKEISEQVKDDLEDKLQRLKNIKQMKPSNNKNFDAYIQAKSNLKDIFATGDDEKIISELINCLQLSEKATLEIVSQFKTMATHQENIDNIAQEAHDASDSFQDIYVNSLEKYTDKLTHNKGKGGRAGATYKQFESIIIKFIIKYGDSPKRERYTIPKAIEDITAEIEGVDGKIRNISESTFKTWKNNFEISGNTIYKLE